MNYETKCYHLLRVILIRNIRNTMSEYTRYLYRWLLLAIKYHFIYNQFVLMTHSGYIACDKIRP